MTLTLVITVLTLFVFACFYELVVILQGRRLVDFGQGGRIDLHGVKSVFLVFVVAWFIGFFVGHHPQLNVAVRAAVLAH